MTIGIAPKLSITENLIADKLHWKRFFRKFGFLDMTAIHSFSDEMVNLYDILCKSPDVPITSLSGGNIQKVVLARELSSAPKLIVANQPTRGVDVGASEFIRKRLIALREKGDAVLLVSSDLEELFTLSDRLIVLYDGKIAACFRDVSSIGEQELGNYMLGLRQQSEEEIKRNSI